MAQKLKDVIDDLPRMVREVTALRENVLANLVMIGEISAPTYREAQRIRFLQDRFSEAGLQNCSTDEVGNGLGIYPGRDGEKNILVVAHADTVIPETVDHTISVDSERVIGPGVGDNSLGLAVIASLPTVLERLGIALESNLILMGASRSLGRGNLEGLRFFLANNVLPIRSGVCVEGVQLGRLSYSSLGMMRGDITCKVPEEYDWSRFGAAGAITIMNEVINRIVEIPLPRRPKTSIVFGSIQGGRSYGPIATDAVLRFEIRSESKEMAQDIADRIENIAGEASAQSRAEVKLDIFASRDPGGIEFGHPLCRAVRRIMKALGLEPRIGPSMSELSALIDRHIPALTIGMTQGEHLHRHDEAIMIEPIFSGIAQLVAILLAVDRGYGDGPE